MVTDIIQANQVTPFTVRALWYLNHFFYQQTWSTGLAYEHELRSINLDYSLASLKRIDDLLVKIRSRGTLDEGAFFDLERNQNFVFLLAFYCGELVGRIRGQAPTWYNYQDFIDKHPQMQGRIPQTFAHYIIVQNPKNELYPKDKIWFPLVAIQEKLFHADVNKSIYQTIRTLLDQYQHISDEQCFTQPTCQYFNIDMMHEIEQLPVQALAYLQQIPSQELLNQHPVYQNLEHLHRLYQYGCGIWAVMVQSPSEYHDVLVPIVDVVYDPTGRSNIETLREVAGKIKGLMQPHHNVNPLNAQFLLQLQQMQGRLLEVDIPANISSVPLKLSSLAIWRPHLPSNELVVDALPVLYDYQDTTSYMTVMPAYFWRDTEYYHYYLYKSTNKTPYSLTIFRKLLEQPDYWQKGFTNLVRPVREHLLKLGSNFQQLASIELANVAEQADVEQALGAFYEKLQAESMTQLQQQTVQQPTQEVIPQHIQQHDYSSALAELSDVQLSQALGLNVLPQIDKAVHYSQLTAEQANKLLDVLLKGTQKGNSTSMLYLAYLYLTGKYVNQSTEQANDLIFGAINAGDWRGYSFKTELLKATQQDPALIVEQYERAMEAGHPTIHTKMAQFAIDLAKKATEPKLNAQPTPQVTQQATEPVVADSISQPQTMLQEGTPPNTEESQQTPVRITSLDEMTEEERIRLYEMMRENKAVWQDVKSKSKIDFSSPIVKGVAIVLVIVVILLLILL